MNSDFEEKVKIQNEDDEEESLNPNPFPENLHISEKNSKIFKIVLIFLQIIIIIIFVFRFSHMMQSQSLNSIQSPSKQNEITNIVSEDVPQQAKEKSEKQKIASIEVRERIKKILTEVKKQRKQLAQEKINKKKENDPNYNPNEQNIQRLIKLMKFPQSKWNRQNPSDKAYFAYHLLKNHDEESFEAETYRFKLLYENFQNTKESPICVSVVSVNPQAQYAPTIKSILRQNYEDFEIIVVLNYSPSHQKQLKEFKGLVNVNIIFNKEGEDKSVLENKHFGIANHCGTESIIVDLDAEDKLIGKQGLKLINYFYAQDRLRWAVYFSNIALKANKPFIESNSQMIPDQLFHENNYRTSDLPLTNHLRTYTKSIYQKIRPSDFMDSKNNFYDCPYNTFIYYSLIQLAGKKHTHKVNEPIYYKAGLNKQLKASQNCQQIARSITPYVNQQNQDDQNQQVEKSEVSEKQEESIIDRQK